MGKRIVTIKKNTKGYNRKMPDGTVQHVSKVKKHTREVETGDKFDTIDEQLAKDLFIERIQKTHPDVLNNAKEMFWKSTKEWQSNMDKYDRLGIDGNTPPEVKSAPDYGKPWTIVQYQGQIYKADGMGVYMKAQDYDDMEIMSKKELAKELGVRDSTYGREEMMRKVYEQRESFRNHPTWRQQHNAEHMTKAELHEKLVNSGIEAEYIKNFDKNELVVAYINRRSYMSDHAKKQEIAALKKQKELLRTEKMNRTLTEFQKAKIGRKIEAIDSEINYFYHETSNKNHKRYYVIATQKSSNEPENWGFSLERKGYNLQNILEEAQADKNFKDVKIIEAKSVDEAQRIYRNS